MTLINALFNKTLFSKTLLRNPSLTRTTLLALLLLVASCATTKVEESWKLPGYTPSEEKKILVVVLASRKKVRKLFEAEFVQQLDDQNITAIASNEWIEDDDKLNRDALRPLLKQNGITMVLVSSLKSVETIQAYQPAQSTGPSDNLKVSMDSYMTFDSSGQHVTGSYVELTDYLVETNAFDSKTEKLSWSITTRTTDQTQMTKSIQDVVKAVVKQGKKDGLFP